MSIQTFLNLSEEKQNKIIQSGLKEFSSKSYSEASTDAITKECSISKGILFHYFESKKKFYLYILNNCMKLLTENAAQSEVREQQVKDTKDFYDLLFDSMDKKMALYEKYPLEILFVNMAAKETNQQIAEEKNKLMINYSKKAQGESYMTIQKAFTMSSLKPGIESTKVEKAFFVYVNALIMSCLERYKNKPQEFFKEADAIKNEMKKNLDYFLYGVIEDERKPTIAKK